MAINQLQRQAFMLSQDFNAQVNGIVTQEAMYKADTWPNMTDSVRSQLSLVAKNPANFGFVNTIISDAAWNIGYDTWALDPDGQKGAISSSVDAWWQFCTGSPNVPPPAPE
jgi:hypothetical protein